MKNLKPLLTALTVLLALSMSAPTSALIEGPAPDLSLEEIRIQFSPCERAVGQQSHPIGYLEQTTHWHELHAVDDKQVRRESHEPTPASTVRVSSAHSNEVHTIDNLQIHDSYWPGIEWALAAGASTFIASADHPGGLQDVLAVLVEDTNGELMFIGECQALTLYDRLFREDSTATTALLRAMIEKTGTDIGAVLRGRDLTSSPSTTAPWRQPDGDNIVVLNPEDVDPSILNSYTHVAVDVDLRGTARPGNTMCVRTAAGWGDCLRLDAETIRNGMRLDAYLNTGSTIEFWLLDNRATLNTPIKQLGDVNLRWGNGGYARTQITDGPIRVDLNLDGHLGDQATLAPHHHATTAWELETGARRVDSEPVTPGNE